MNLGPLMFHSRKIKGKYDYVIVGSDIVWNFKDPFLGSDPIYFGQGLDGTRLISYAPSFGNISISDSLPDFVSRGIKNFEKISVRDTNSAEIIKNISGVEPETVLDPTFLIDPSPFERVVSRPHPYLLVYAYHLREHEIRSAKAFAKQRGLQTVAVGYRCDWADKNVIALGPFEWLGYFKNASYVLTSTFHGTIFSLKYQKNFA